MGLKRRKVGIKIGKIIEVDISVIELKKTLKLLINNPVITKNNILDKLTSCP